MPRPVHFEIFGKEPLKAVTFYINVFGWTVSRWGEDEYWLVGTGEGPGINGALGSLPDHGQPVVLTMEVEDLADSVRKVKEHGGTVMVERAPIHSVGWYALCRDTNGVVFSMLEPDPQAA